MMYNMKTMEFEQFGLCSFFRTIVLNHAELAKKSEIGSQLPYLELTIHAQSGSTRNSHSNNKGSRISRVISVAENFMEACLESI
ncbi:unnamed protein product [Sphagnum compactum]